MNVTNLAPISLFEPVTGLKLRAENFSLYNQGDENITLSFHKILVLPEELVKATQSLIGKGLIVTHTPSDDVRFVRWTQEDGLSMANDSPIQNVSMVQVVSDMKRTGEIYNIERTIRHYYLYDQLITKIIRTPMEMSELVETENIKLLEEYNARRRKA